MSKVVIILRGVSSAGKTTFAKSLKRVFSNRIKICCADDYFYQNGNYKFDASQLGKAHGQCKQIFYETLTNKGFQGCIIVANTNCKWRDAKYYYDKASELGVPCFSLVVEKRHDGDNGHCNDEIKTRQLESLLNSLKLS